MSSEILICRSATLVRPDQGRCDRLDAGRLIVDPPRSAWQRGCRTAHQLARRALLAAAPLLQPRSNRPTLNDGQP